jgi:hypothetical protein
MSLFVLARLHNPLWFAAMAPYINGPTEYRVLIYTHKRNNVWSA